MNMTFRILVAAVFLTIAGVAIAGVNGSPNRRDAAMVLPVAVTPDGGLIELRVDSAGALAVTSTGSSTFSGAVAATQSGAWAVTSTGTSTVSGTVAATQSGAWAVSQAATSTAWTVDATARSSGAEASVTCGTSTAASVPASPMAGRKTLWLQNRSAVNALVGLSPTNSPAFGAEIIPGASMTWTCSPTACPVKCISESVSATSTLYAIEVQ